MQDQLFLAGEREENIPCDLNDCSWFEKIDASDGAVFFAACEFYYFLTEQVKTLVQAMPRWKAGLRYRRHPGRRLLFLHIRCQKRAFPTEQEPADFQPGIYAGVSEFRLPFRQRILSIFSKIGRPEHEDADRPAGFFKRSGTVKHLAAAGCYLKKHREIRLAIEPRIKDAVSEWRINK